jgi:5'-deoxynucleotidase YfbR-like HD superfamily hydrolase
MISVLEKVRGLIAQAVGTKNPTPDPEEICVDFHTLADRRSAALQAVKLIDEYRLLDRNGNEELVSALREEIQNLERQIRELRHPRRTILVAKYSSTCVRCGGTYGPGDQIAWARGLTSIHASCYMRDREEGAP